MHPARNLKTFFLVTLVICAFVGFAAACATYSADYTLSADIYSGVLANQSCIIMNTSGTTLDCAGHPITLNNSEGSIAINISANSVTVKGCNISNASIAIYSNRNSSTIFNNTISVPQNSTAMPELWQGIFLNGSWSANVSDNVISNVSANRYFEGSQQYGPSGILLFNSRNSVINSNNVTAAGKSAESLAIYSSSGTVAFANNLSGSPAGACAVALNGKSASNSFQSNYISGTSSSAVACLGFSQNAASDSNNSAEFTNDVFACSASCAFAVYTNRSSSANITNATFNRAKQFSVGSDSTFGPNSVTVKWFIIANASYTEGTPIAGAWVNATDLAGAVEASNITGATGLAMLQVVEFVNVSNSTGVFLQNRTQKQFILLNSTNGTRSYVFYNATAGATISILINVPSIGAIGRAFFNASAENFTARVSVPIDNVSMVLFSTNESGVWANHSGLYGSPLLVDRNATIANFTWFNATYSSPDLCIRLWANSSSGQWNSSAESCIRLANASFVILASPVAGATTNPVSIAINASGILENSTCWYSLDGTTTFVGTLLNNTQSSSSITASTGAHYVNATCQPRRGIITGYNATSATVAFSIPITGSPGCCGSSGWYSSGTGTGTATPAPANSSGNVSNSTATPNPSNVTNFSAQSNATLGIDRERLALIVENGKETKIDLRAFNRQALAESNVTVEISDEIRDMVNVTVNFTKLAANSSAQIGFTINPPADKPAGKYYGMITLSDGKTTVSVPVSITVQPSSEQLLKISVMPISNSVKAGTELRVSIEVFNLGVEEQMVGIRILLSDAATDRVVAATSENVTIKTSFNSVKSILVPDRARGGKHIIKAVAYTIGNATRYMEASDSAEVIVESAGAQSVFEGALLPIIVALLFIGFAGFFAYRKFDESKRKRFLKEIDFDALPGPDSGSAFVGKIAETNRDAYFVLDKLCTHLLAAGTTGSGKTVGAQVIVEEALLHGVSAIVLDPTGQWSGFLRPQKDAKMLGAYTRFGYKKTDARAFEGRIRVVRSVQEQFRIRECLRPGQVTILALNELSKAEGREAVVSAELEQFVCNVFEDVFSANLEESPKLRALIVCDEVHRLLPKFGASGKAFNEIERGVREFRKWGVGVVLISQVTADFVGEIKANIGTELQFRSKNENDLERVVLKFGEHYAEGIVKSRVGTGLLQNPDFNKGRPYFVAFRPLLHNLSKLSEAELAIIGQFDSELDAIAKKIDIFRAKGADVEDAMVELDLARSKTQLGHFDVVKVYIKSISSRIEALEKNYP